MKIRKLFSAVIDTTATTVWLIFTGGILWLLYKTVWPLL